MTQAGCCCNEPGTPGCIVCYTNYIPHSSTFSDGTPPQYYVFLTGGTRFNIPADYGDMPLDILETDLAPTCELEVITGHWYYGIVHYNPTSGATGLLCDSSFAFLKSGVEAVELSGNTGYIVKVDVDSYNVPEGCGIRAIGDWVDDNNFKFAELTLDSDGKWIYRLGYSHDADEHIVASYKTASNNGWDNALNLHIYPDRFGINGSLLFPTYPTFPKKTYYVTGNERESTSKICGIGTGVNGETLHVRAFSIEQAVESPPSITWDDIDCYLSYYQLMGVLQGGGVCQYMDIEYTTPTGSRNITLNFVDVTTGPNGGPGLSFFIINVRKTHDPSQFWTTPDPFIAFASPDKVITYGWYNADEQMYMTIAKKSFDQDVWSLFAWSPNFPDVYFGPFFIGGPGPQVALGKEFPLRPDINEIKNVELTSPSMPGYSIRVTARHA